MMKAPRPNALTICLVLAALATGAALLPSPLAVAVTGVLLALLAAELDRSGRYVALRLVKVASRLLPSYRRDVEESQWVDHVLCAGEAGMRPVFVALWIVFLAAPRLGFRYHFRIRAAVFIGRLFLSYQDVEARILGRLQHNQPVAKRAVVFAAVTVVMALPGVTLIYPLSGRRVARCPSLILAGAGCLMWVAPLATVFLLRRTELLAIARMTELFIWALSVSVGSRVLFSDSFGIRVIDRIAGLRAAGD